jgi:hypothetical protein
VANLAKKQLEVTRCLSCIEALVDLSLRQRAAALGRAFVEEGVGIGDNTRWDAGAGCFYLMKW